jgi:hypothetical protein
VSSCSTTTGCSSFLATAAAASSCARTAARKSEEMSVSTASASRPASIRWTGECVCECVCVCGGGGKGSVCKAVLLWQMKIEVA